MFNIAATSSVRPATATLPASPSTVTQGSRAGFLPAPSALEALRSTLALGRTSFVAAGTASDQGDEQSTTVHATRGMDAVRGAAVLAHLAGPEVASAITAAGREATSGMRLLEIAPQAVIAPGAVSTQFNSAANWLGIAERLVMLQHTAG